MINIIKNHENISYTFFIQIVSSERESPLASMVHFVRTTSSTINRLCLLSSITRATVLVPSYVVKSLQLIWKADTRSSTGARSLNELQWLYYQESG